MGVVTCLGAAGRNSRCLGFLLRCGADPTIVTYNARHETALHLAAAAAHAQCVTQLLGTNVYDGERHVVPLHLAINQQACDFRLGPMLRTPFSCCWLASFCGSSLASQLKQVLIHTLTFGTPARDGTTCMRVDAC